MTVMILYLGLSLLAIANLCVAATNGTNATVKCQFGKRLPKQVDVEPLNGMCLYDIVRQFSKMLYSITNEELGLTDFQESLNKLDFTHMPDNIDAKLNVLADKLNSKLLSHVDLLRQSNEVIQPILMKEQNYPYASDAMKFGIANTRGSELCSQIITGFATNIRNQEWKNLHVLPMKQPGTMCGPPSLAHNIGPLLLSQTCPSKNVILLLEHGTFMSEGDLALAQITAKTIIDMLSESDYVNAIGLAGQGFIHCDTGLLRATDINKFRLARHIDGIIRLDSNQTMDLDLNTMTQNAEHDIVIIHLTNTLGDTSRVRKIVQKIASGQLVSHLRTVLILSDRESHTRLNMTSMNDTVITLPTQNVLGYEIAKLFFGLKCPQKTKKNYYLSDPYFEPYSKSMIVSMGQITNTALLSLDIKLQDFLDDITYFNAGANTYAMLFDSREIVWMHKEFPRVESMVEQPLKVYLQNIENLSKENVTAMLNQVAGNISIKAKLGSQKEYRWKRLAYENLIICIVSTGNIGQLSISRVAPILPKDILHHRLDLILPTIIDKDTLCSRHNKIITYSTGVVYLSPWCFQSPMEQLRLLETGSAVTVQSYMAYIKDLTGLLANPGLHQSVRADVATLAQILDYFKKQHTASSLNKFIIRRYIVGTVSGALEMFPGIVLDAGLDPKRRAWYIKALEHVGKVVLTPPYLDAGGSGYVITLSSTVQRTTEKNVNDEPTAIISMDVTMGYISRLLIEMFPFCNDSTVKCFLMDDKGYLVSHPSLLEPMSKVEQHLTHKELLVANDILNHEFFVKKKVCANHLDGTIQRYYQFNTSLEQVLTNIVHGEHCVKYQVAAIPGTNVFFGIVNITCNSLRAFCPCSTMDRLCLNCKRMEQTECECPCECSLYSSDCLQHINNNLQPCSAPYEQGTHPQTSWMQQANLKTCPSYNCKTYEMEAECLGIVGCQWCYIEADAETLMQTPFCSDMALCFKGILGSPLPYSDGTYNSQSTEEIVIREWPSCGPVAGGILAFVLILGTTLFCYRLRSVQSGLEHQCLHLHTSPDTLRMTHLEGDPEPLELDPAKNNLNSLIRDSIAPISPYRVSTNYRRPPGGDSDHGYSTMTPHDDSEQQTFAEPLLIVGNNVELDQTRQSFCTPPVTTHLGSPHHVLAPVTVHRNMETNYC